MAMPDAFEGYISREMIERILQQEVDIRAAIRALRIDPDDGIEAIADAVRARFGLDAELTLTLMAPPADGWSVAVVRGGVTVWEGGG